MNKTMKTPSPTVHVTQKHIDTAVPKSSGHCMIADAIRDAVPGAEYISVDVATIRWTDRIAGYRYFYFTPRSAQVALMDFDQGVKPKPFSFKLRAGQVRLTGNASKARSQRRLRATLVEQANRPNGVPIKVGGSPMPVGALASGPSGKKRKGPERIGRRREFGLKQLG